MRATSPSPRPRRTSSPPRRRWTLPATVLVTCGVVSGALVLPGAGAATGGEDGAVQDAVQQGLEDLVAEDGFPGALASVRGADGTVVDYTAGVGDLDSGDPVPVDGRVRIGSNTKTFTATVVLQLVDEGRVDLDAPVEAHLPGLVRGEGIDGRSITVRQLLQHTSGLADYDQAFAEDLLVLEDLYLEPRDVVDLGLGFPALFTPGAGWSYSNTGYVLAGLLVQKVTGRPIGEEITRRIIEPLGLEDTSWPSPGDRSIPGPNPRGYFAAAPGGALVDITASDTSFTWAAGALISTPSELAEFTTALLAGQLLSPAMLAEMQAVVAAPDSSARGDEAYGLGLQTFTLSCGGVAWGHGGDILGYQTRNAATTEGRSAVVAVTALPTTLEAARHVEDVVDAALCLEGSA